MMDQNSHQTFNKKSEWFVGRDSQNNAVNLLNSENAFTKISIDCNPLPSLPSNIEDTLQSESSIHDESPIYSPHKSRFEFHRSMDLNDKQSLIQNTANALFPEYARHNGLKELPYKQWINMIVVNQVQMAEKNGVFNNKKKLISSVLRKMIEYQSGVPIGQVPWKKISKTDMIGWPEDIEIKSPSKLNALELNKILLALENIEFKINI